MRTGLAIALLLAIPLGRAQEPPARSASKMPAWISMTPYEPLNPRSLADIPESVRSPLIAHLEARLGEEFYRRLRFAGGQVVDFNELHRINPRSANYRWEVPAYNLHFEFRMPDPSKLAFIALSDALNIAKSRGFEPGEASVDIDYDPAADAIVWKIREVVSDNRVIIRFRIIEIHVHDGRVAKVYDAEGIR